MTTAIFSDKTNAFMWIVSYSRKMSDKLMRKQDKNSLNSIVLRGFSFVLHEQFIDNAKIFHWIFVWIDFFCRFFLRSLSRILPMLVSLLARLFLLGSSHLFCFFYKMTATGIHPKWKENHRKKKRGNRRLYRMRWQHDELHVNEIYRKNEIYM